MKEASIKKRSRVEIQSMIDDWRRRLSYFVYGYQTKSERAHCESLKAGIVRYEQMLKSTDDEYIYEFKGKMVNDILPQEMKF